MTDSDNEGDIERDLVLREDEADPAAGLAKKRIEIHPVLPASIGRISNR